MAAQVRRSARRDLDAVRLRPARRRDDRAQHRAAPTAYGGSSSIYNSGQPSYFGGDSTGSAGTRDAGRRPRISLSRSFPISAFGQQIIEPIAQLIVRPNEVICRSCSPTRTRRAWCSTRPTCSPGTSTPATTASKAARALNYGAQYTANFANGGHANIVGGEFDPARRAEFLHASPTPPTPGSNPGLDKHFSNYVIGETIAPFSSNFSLTSKQQFDSDDLRPHAPRRDRQRLLRRLHHQHRLRPLRRAARRSATSSRAKGC